MGRFTKAALAVVLALAAVTGCSTNPHGASTAPSVTDTTPLAELQRAADPRGLVGPSTAVLANTAVTPVVDGKPQQQLPTTVTSHTQGGGTEEYEITDTSRVVAIDLAGTIAASVFALGLGDTVVGKDQSTTFPGTEDIPIVTEGGHNINVESVIALRPTLVITDGSIGPRDVVEQLRDVGIPVVFVKNEASFAGAQDLARQVAAVYGVPEVGEQLAEQIGEEVDSKIAEIAAIAPQGDDRVRMLFLYLRGNAGVYYLFGEESGADELIEALGGIDVAGELGWQGMRPMTDEALVAANPDLILVMTGGLESVGGVDGLLAEKLAVAATRAGQNRRFVDMADGAILSFGPNSAGVLDALARAIYAPEQVTPE